MLFRSGADSLKQQAANLTQVVGVFKLSHDAQASQAAALHHSAERRGPHCATNGTRRKFGAKSAALRHAASPAPSAPAAPAAKIGTDDWKAF